MISQRSTYQIDLRSGRAYEVQYIRLGKDSAPICKAGDLKLLVCAAVKVTGVARLFTVVSYETAHSDFLGVTLELEQRGRSLEN